MASEPERREWRMTAGDAVIEDRFVTFADPEPERRALGPLVVAGALIVLALAWLAGLAAALAAAAPPGGLSALRLAAWVGLGSAPLALLAVIALLLLRSGRSEATAYARAAGRLRQESNTLAEMLALLTRRIEAARVGLAEQGTALTELGASAEERLGRAGAQLRIDGEALEQTARRLDDATATARTDMGVLLADLPQAEARAATLAERLRDFTETSGAHVETLATQLTRIEEQARGADSGSVAAARRLAIELERIEGSAAAADRRVAEAAARLAAASDEALNGAVAALDTVRKGLGDQGTALAASVAQGRAQLATAGDEAARLLGERLDTLTARIDAMGERLRGHEAAARGLVGQLDQALGAVEARFAGLGDTGAEHTADLAEALAALAGHADGIGRSLGQGGHAAEALLARAQALRAEVDASGAALATALPQALGRFREEAQEGLQAIAQAEPRVHALAEEAGSVGRQLAGGEAVLDRQAERLAALAAQARAFEAAVAESDGALRHVAEGSSTHLVDALLRVRETAAQAAAHARDALAGAVPQAAATLAEDAERAMRDALGQVGREEIAALGAASEAAAGAANAASERLSRQLMTLAETTQVLEARIARHESAVRAQDEGSFARQVGLLIEALNSTAIDVTKIFSNAPTDTAWAAYLKGDRGVFTRRAVRLLDAGEAGAICERYRDDPEFHDQVNRYVHDYEAMLRRVLAVREGQSMAVALLSSDMGKLYVALAQAIERLRR